MALLAKEEDKEAIELDGGIGRAIAAHLLRLLRLLACVEQSLGENGLLEGAMMENSEATKFLVSAAQRSASWSTKRA